MHAGQTKAKVAKASPKPPPRHFHLQRHNLPGNYRHHSITRENASQFLAAGEAKSDEQAEMGTCSSGQIAQVLHKEHRKNTAIGYAKKQYTAEHMAETSRAS